MSKRWYQDNRRDAWRRIARSKGYRTRSAYKLKQIQERFGILRKADVVLDVGCHPGGWTQVAVEEVGKMGWSSVSTCSRPRLSKVLESSSGTSLRREPWARSGMPLVSVN